MTCWTGSQLVQPIEKNSEILTVDYPKNKKIQKKATVLNSKLDEGELAKTRQCVYKTGLDMQDLLNRFPTSTTDWEKFWNFNSRLPKE